MNALVLTNENKLTGSRDLQLGDPVSLLQPGVLVLTASNSFTGGVTINPSRGSGLNFNASPILISRAAGALGSGPISINRGSSVGLPPVLQFEVPYLVLTNSITITNALSSVAINTFGPLTLRGNLTVYGTNSLNIMASNSLSPLTIFDQVSAGNAVSFVGQNGILNVENGLFDPVSAVNIPMNIGFRVNSGMLVLSPGFSWSNLVAGGRTWMNTSSPTSGQWKVCNFAARGATQVIDGTGAFETGKTNTWLLDGSGSAPMLGSLVTNADGTFYANAGIKITRDITLALPYPLNVKIASTGPGLTNASVAGIVHELAGTLSGPGSLYLTGSGTANAGLIPELVLSGSSLWTNGVTLGYQGAMKIMTGPGGMGMAGNAISGFVRFKGNASLPSGNGGAPAYIFAGCVYQNAGLYGFLLTGSTSNQVYSLTNGMRFVLGGLASSGVGPYYGTFGSAYENTTLTNSMISVWNSSSATNNQYLNLLVRDTNGIFTLGSSAGSVKFSSSYCVGTNGINNWAMTNGIEPMLDRVAISTLIKRGPGVLVLSNVTYELFAGGGNISTNFSWQLGSGTMNLDDGVVRETGTSTNDSMRTQYIVFNGAVMGLSADYPVARIGTNNTQINMAGAAGGGFAAYGASRTVTLIPSGSTNTLGWGTTSATAPDFFMTATAPMILNAKDADASVVLESAQTNAIKLVTANNNYTIKVMDNPLTTTDQAVMAIRLTSVTNLVGASLTKNGPGTLVLTATNNDYQAATFVSNGTLIVNGNLHSNRVATASNVTVCSGATLSGTGTIARTVMVLAGGTLTAGAGSDQPGTLTVSNLMLSATGTLVVDVSASGVDKVVVGGGAVALTGALLVVPAAGYDMTGGDNLTIMTAASFSGEFTSVPRGYTVRIEGTNLILHRDSPGFIFRIQ
jgi:autotransporter-associated beta strand protein